MTTIWFIGLHCSGKTTLSKELAKSLTDSGKEVTLLDGDEVRKTISADLGYTLEDRNEHMRRVADHASEVDKGENIVIACVASPTKESRDYAKDKINDIITVYVKCSVEECERRDVKGHYKKARNQEPGFESFLGISLPFEEPTDADIVLDTEKNNIQECMKILEEELNKKLS